MNAFNLKCPTAGSPLSAVQMRQITDAIRRYLPKAGAGVRVSYTMGGAVISCNVRPSVGGAGVAELYPYKCRFVEEESGDSSGSDSGGGGYYKFYLPEGSDSATMSGCLNLNGRKVQFEQMSPADTDDKDTFDRYSWKKVNDSADMVLDSVSSGYEPKEGESVTRDSGGLVVCVLMRNSSSRSGFDARIMTEKALANITGSDSGFLPDTNIFPVCYIHELDIQTTTGEGEEAKTTTTTVREVKQFAVGEQMINGTDNFPFRIVMTDCGAMVTNNIYRLEEFTAKTDYEYRIEDSCAGEYLWFCISGGSEYFQHGQLDSFNAILQDPSVCAIPLYKFTDTNTDGRFMVETDLRFVPTCQVWMNEVTADHD